MFGGTAVPQYTRPCPSTAVTRPVSGAELSMSLGIGDKAVAQVGGGKRKPYGRLDVAVLQSFVRGDTVDDIVATYVHVIADERKHVPCGVLRTRSVKRQGKVRHRPGWHTAPARWPSPNHRDADGSRPEVTGSSSSMCWASVNFPRTTTARSMACLRFLFLVAQRRRRIPARGGVFEDCADVPAQPAVRIELLRDRSSPRQ